MKENPETHFSLEWTTKVKIPALCSAKMEGSPFIEPEHILVALLWREQLWLNKLTEKPVKVIIGEAMVHFPPHEVLEHTEPLPSAKTAEVLEYALKLADPDATDVSPFFILVALLEMEGVLTMGTKEVLAANKINVETARTEMRRRFDH